MVAAFISGCASTKLSVDERAFFSDVNPWGLILFKRNCETAEQIRALVDDYRGIVGRADAPVLIDQEGGRVQRLTNPHWRVYPSPEALVQAFGDDPETLLEACRLHGQLLGSDLAALGITVDCLPVLDLRFDETHAVIGNRSFGRNPETVARLAGAQTDGLMAAGVLPVMKHIPGHGRGNVDSHHELPTVTANHEALSADDFMPFKTLAQGMPMAMTAHIVYSAIDPDCPATTSKTMVEDVIRGEIGFDGLLMTDDLSMQALAGTLSERAEAAFAAGCDMGLHCNGLFDEMVAVASKTPVLDGHAKRRADAALAARRTPEPFDAVAAYARIEVALTT
ncbi:MAG: beta-N-acetylhexosaminidase [Pseudomonadota bacterium]